VSLRESEVFLYSMVIDIYFKLFLYDHINIRDPSLREVAMGVMKRSVINIKNNRAIFLCPSQCKSLCGIHSDIVGAVIPKSTS
jgi:hypothetical protein